ncbi:MAG TPA: 2-hydroxycarboxylate transporter family protein [Stenotrophomonas sp.]|nr:2-hydroxycarboxylate transporter family protein [Stenotrophomonas sp.]
MSLHRIIRAQRRLLPRRVPHIPGLTTLVFLLLPSYAVHAGWIGAALVQDVRIALESGHVLMMFVGVIVIGGLLGIDARGVLRSALLIGVLVIVPSALALMAGASMAVALDLDVRDVLLTVLAPAMGGGVSSGALPLAFAYQTSTGQSDVLARLLPAVVLANFMAIIAAAAVTRLHAGKGAGDRTTLLQQASPYPVSPGPTRIREIALATVALLSCIAFIGWIGRLTGMNEALLLIMVALLLAMGGLVPAGLHRSIDALYRFATRVLLAPLLIVVGAVYVPWATLVSSLTAAKVLVLGAAVLTLAMAGAWMAQWARLQSDEGAFIALSRAAMGGSGDIALLDAARRMDLLPLALLSTRLGGWLTVFLALLIL